MRGGPQAKPRSNPFSPGRWAGLSGISAWTLVPDPGAESISQRSAEQRRPLAHPDQPEPFAHHVRLEADAVV